MYLFDSTNEWKQTNLQRHVYEFASCIINIVFVRYRKLLKSFMQHRDSRPPENAFIVVGTVIRIENVDN